MINLETLKRLARISMIDIQEDECFEYKKRVDLVVDMYEKISHIKTDAEPMYDLSMYLENYINNMVEDTVENSPKEVKEVIDSSPSNMHNFFTVPKVID